VTDGQMADRQTDRHIDRHMMTGYSALAYHCR